MSLVIRPGGDVDVSLVIRPVCSGKFVIHGAFLEFS